MSKNDTIVTQDILLKILAELTEIKYLLKSQEQARNNQLPRRI